MHGKKKEDDLKVKKVFIYSHYEFVNNTGSEKLAIH
jgi:hypothetical protein